MGGGVAVAEHGHEAGQHEQAVGVAAERRGPGTDVRAERDRRLERVLGGEDDVGVPGGEVAPRSRRPGLEDHRPTLRGRRQGGRAADGEVLAVVIDRVDVVGVDVAAARLVADECLR